jgi:hypothetical protein
MDSWSVASSTPGYRLNGARVIPQPERLARMSFFHLDYAASGSDGRYYARMLIAVDCHDYAASPEAWVRQAVLTIGGWPMHFIMGVCPAEAWHLRKATEEDWANRATGRCSQADGSPECHEALFLSDGPPIPGWPAPARLEDLQSGAAIAARVENWRGYGCDGAKPHPSREQLDSAFAMERARKAPQKTPQDVAADPG